MVWVTNKLMRYLKLFEGFEGSVISSVIGFLNKKGITTGNLFLEKLKGICDEFDIPLSRITNDNLKYLPSSKAIKIKPEYKSNKFNNINCIKFWFSIDKYLGYTGVGYIESSSKSFFDNFLNNIKNRVGVTKGSIERVSSYRQLKNGDDIVLYIEGDVVFSKFYTFEGTCYAIQNRHSGSTPNDNNWKLYGRYSWELSDITRHKELSKYKPSDDPLQIKWENDYDFNLPIRYSSLTTWDNSFNSISNIEKIDESLFCIILYLDGLESIDRVSISNSRFDNKKTSLALISDKDIKNANIERYYGKILSSMTSNSDEDLNNTKNINRLLLSYVRSRYSIFSIINDDPSVSNLRSLSNCIKKVVINKGSEESIKNATRDLTNSIRTCDNIESGYMKSINSISSPEESSISSLIIPTIELLLSIGDVIHDYCKHVKLDNLYDYTSVYLKINSLRSVFANDQYKLSDELIRIIQNLYYYNDIHYYLNDSRFVADMISKNSKDLYKLEAIYKHTKSIFIY